jgi:hypothetical protein
MTMILDSQGFAIPAVDLELDHLTDNLVDDLDYGPAELWPDWTDADRWELRLEAPALEAAVYEPSEADRREFTAWCAEQDQRRQDLEDMHREEDYQDTLELERRFTDQDLIAAGLPVG